MAHPRPPSPPAPEEVPAPADAQRALPTPFLTKTYQLVDDPAVDDLISWNEDGSTFVVWRPAEFSRDLLPKHFKHNNFSSFVRQLNTYGFRKTVPDRWEFANDCFRKGEKRLLSDIQRRKILASPAVPTAVAVVAPLPENRAAASPMNSGGDEEVPPSVSPPRAAAPSTSTPGNGGASPGLVEDNNRLRKENQRLKQEVSRIKSLCSNIHNLMSKYACQQLPHRPRPQPETAEKPPAPASPLELMPMTRCSVSSEAASPCRDDRADPEDEEFEEEEEEEEEEVEEGMPNPRLFGVSIGAKRARSGEGERARDEQPQRRRQVVEVKLEPLDPRPPPEGGGHRWRVCSSSCRSPHRGVCS